MEDQYRNFCPREGESPEMATASHEHSIRKAAFESKHGYSQKRFEEKLKDQMNGMPMPMHMRRER